MRHSYGCFDLGGSIHTHENAVCIYGGAGVTVEEYTKLAIPTSSSDTEEDDDEQEASSSSSSGFTSQLMSNLNRSLRKERRGIIRSNLMNADAARAAYPLRAERPKKEIPVFHAERMRSPVVVDVTCGTFRVRVAVLHAPGPGAKSDHEGELLAQTYFGDVMPVCMGSQVDVVIGDFNLYRTPPVTAYFEEVPLNAGTTYGNRESKLDRIFVRRDRFRFETRVLGPEEQPSYTDHKAVALRNFGTADSPATVRTQTPRPTMASSSSSSSFRGLGDNPSKMRRIDADDE
jgi:hypothetical protein